MNAKEVYLQFLLAHGTTGLSEVSPKDLDEFLTNLGAAFKKDGL